MNRHVSSSPWLSLNTSHSPLSDFTSPWCWNCSCYSVTALSIVDVVIKSLLRCQTMDMFRHLYRSGTFAYSMLNTTVSIAHRLFTYLCLFCACELLCMGESYCVDQKRFCRRCLLRSVSRNSPSCCASLVPLCFCMNVSTRCSLMVSGIDIYHLLPLCFGMNVPTRCCLMVSGIDIYHLLPLCFGMNVPTRCSLMVSGIDIYHLLPLCFGMNVPTRCSLMVSGIDIYHLFNVTILDISSR